MPGPSGGTAAQPTRRLCLPQSLVDMAPKYILEQFLQQELLINITEHEVGLRPGWVGAWAGLPAGGDLELVAVQALAPRHVVVVGLTQHSANTLSTRWRLLPGPSVWGSP